MDIKKFYINEEIAKAANNANSFRDYPEKKATGEYLDLVEQFGRAVDELVEENRKSNFPANSEQMELVQYYSNKYSEKLAEAMNRYHSIEASCPSMMISGAGNFPTRRKEKQNSARDRFWADNGSLFEPTDSYYFKKIKNLLTSKTIYGSDALAVEKLKTKLADLEELHARMKEYNSYYRKNKTMKGFSDLSEEKAELMDKKIESSLYKVPCPSYRLALNNAEMKRIKGRINDIEKMKEEAKKPSEDKYPHVDGVEVVENAEAMRIQLIFDGKPEEETRQLLKSNGFRWSPRFGAWQRQLTDNGIRATRRVLERIASEKAS